MPAKNLIRIDVEDSYYHIYNRGVEKRVIFEDDQDYKVFLSYLKDYLSPPPDPNKSKKIFTLQGLSFKGIPYQVKNYFGKIELNVYALLPNHFHFLIHQIEISSIEKLTRSLLTRYSMYFNKKYNRVGTLFQGPYKSKMVLDENYLLHLSRYIHLNPREHQKNLTKAYSSYADYIGIRKTKWIKTDPILKYFKNNKSTDFKYINSYKDFVEKYKPDADLEEFPDL